MDVIYSSWSVPPTPCWHPLNRWVFSWCKSAELSWDSFTSTKNPAQNTELISHASDCQTVSLADRTIIGTRSARNTWKTVLELQFWQPCLHSRWTRGRCSSPVPVHSLGALTETSTRFCLPRHLLAIIVKDKATTPEGSRWQNQDYWELGWKLSLEK